MNVLVYKWQALISRLLSVTHLWTELSPIYRDSSLRTCQKESHRDFTLQDAYLGCTFTTLKNTMGMIDTGDTGYGERQHNVHCRSTDGDVPIRERSGAATEVSAGMLPDRKRSTPSHGRHRSGAWGHMAHHGKRVDVMENGFFRHFFNRHGSVLAES